MLSVRTSAVNRKCYYNLKKFSYLVVNSEQLFNDTKYSSLLNIPHFETKLGPTFF